MARHVVVFLISEFESKCLAVRILLECNETLNKTIRGWYIFNCEVRNGYITFYCWEIAFVLHDFVTILWSYVNYFCELWLAMFQDLVNCTVLWHLDMKDVLSALYVQWQKSTCRLIFEDIALDKNIKSRHFAMTFNHLEILKNVFV